MLAVWVKALLPELSICRKVMLYHATKHWEHFDIWPFTIKPFIKMYNMCPESQSQNIQFNDLKISPDDLVARLPLAFVFAIGLRQFCITLSMTFVLFCLFAMKLRDERKPTRLFLPIWAFVRCIIKSMWRL